MALLLPSAIFLRHLAGAGAVVRARAAHWAGQQQSGDRGAGGRACLDGRHGQSHGLNEISCLLRRLYQLRVTRRSRLCISQH